MKKLLALALAIMILAAVPALADFEGQTLEQLQDTAARVQAEILRRSGEPFTLWPGRYTVGVDIPAGAYRVEIKTGGSGLFWVYTQADDLFPTFQGSLSTYEEVAAPIIGKVTLADGMIVDLTVAVTMSAYTGVGE